MKAFKYLTLTILCFVVLWIIDIGYVILIHSLPSLYWAIGSSYFAVIIVLLGGLTWKVFKFLSSLLIRYLSRMLSNRTYIFGLVTALSLLNAVYRIIKAWIPYKGTTEQVIASIILTILMLDLTVALIWGAWLEKAKQ
jgi:hypothetical protein